MPLRDQLEELRASRDRAAQAVGAASLVLKDIRERETAAQRFAATGARVPALAAITVEREKASAAHEAAVARLARLDRQIAGLEARERTVPLRVRRDERPAPQPDLPLAEHFMRVARELLDRDVFATLMREATLAKSRHLVRSPSRSALGGTGAALEMPRRAPGVRVRHRS